MIVKVQRVHLSPLMFAQMGLASMSFGSVVPEPSASQNAQPMTPMKAIALLSTLQSADIVLPTTDGREIRLRRVTEPTAEQKLLLGQLGISLPEQLQFHRECSADSAIS